MRKALLVLSCYFLLWPVTETTINVLRPPYYSVSLDLSLFLVGVVYGVIFVIPFAALHLPMALMLRCWMKAYAKTDPLSDRIFWYACALLAIPLTPLQWLCVHYKTGGFDSECQSGLLSSCGIATEMGWYFLFSSTLTGYVVGRVLTLPILRRPHL